MLTAEDIRLDLSQNLVHLHTLLFMRTQRHIEIRSCSNIVPNTTAKESQVAVSNISAEANLLRPTTTICDMLLYVHRYGPYYMYIGTDLVAHTVCLVVG